MGIIPRAIIETQAKRPRITARSVQRPRGVSPAPKKSPQTGKLLEKKACAKILITAKTSIREREANTAIEAFIIFSELFRATAETTSKIARRRILPKVPTSKLYPNIDNEEGELKTAEKKYMTGRRSVASIIGCQGILILLSCQASLRKTMTKTIRPRTIRIDLASPRLITPHGTKNIGNKNINAMRIEEVFFRSCIFETSLIVNVKILPQIYLKQNNPAASNAAGLFLGIYKPNSVPTLLIEGEQNWR